MDYQIKGEMADTTNDKEFILALLEERDRLYRHNARLQSKLNELESVDVEIASCKQTIEEQKLIIEKKDQKIGQLEYQLQYLRRKYFGKSSEKFITPDPLQRKLDFEGLDVLPEEKALAREAQKQIIEYKIRRTTAKSNDKPVRQNLPDSLERREERIRPAGVDEENWKKIGEEITEILEHKPDEFYVRRIIREKWVLKNKTLNVEKEVVIAPMPFLPIAKSFAGASLLAEILNNKYTYHIPFYRQLQMFKQTGLSLSASTVNGWFSESADMLRPLYYRLKEIILSTDYLQVDETTVPIINNEKHKTVKGYLWMVRAVIQNLVLFYYDHGSRAQSVAIGLLKDFRGALQTDGYEVYSIYEKKKGVLPIGCWAHARRYFEQALEDDKARATYALEQIALLYDVEKQADNEDLSYTERADLRSRLAYPILVLFEKWLYKEYDKVLPKSRIGKAISYTYKIFPRLTRYHLDGRYRIDNNLAENAIRPIALGRKNFLFCGNHDAAEQAAIIYSMMGCCKACEVDPRKWMEYVFNHIHDYDNDYSKDLAELLPHNLKTQIGENL